ncbi:sensor domain-containing diguanylate cyclase [Paroceanicella profunda]|uniref:sensor domain-containing diguanylate cyclase n=1 Tax=Paroceanicella profunda TaxID=2579971 RepID=UPI001EEFB6DD|nr:sensor domain-containing diguanylate cyclase [Paroceanicella profunda]
MLDEPARLAALHRYRILDTLPEAGFEQITALVRTIYHAPMVLMNLIDSDRQWCKSCQGTEPSEMPREITFCQHTIRSREALVIEDTFCDRRFADHPMVVGPPGIRAYLGAPLQSPDGYNVGALCVIDTRPVRFSGEQIAILHGFADLVVAQMELRLIAARDSLTGTRTRRAFEEQLDLALSDAARGGPPSWLVLLDIDHFKAVNDTHGHGAGDAVLAALCATVDTGLRRGDTIGRLGGEEFGVLLRQDSAQEAFAIAERLRTAVAQMRVPDAPGVAITASFGLARCQPDFTSAAQWLAAADVCLYRAKRGGRNRCVL